jgi:glucose-1-phosphate adenylyltransferase
MHQPRVLTLILAGGTGGRMGVLTDHRAKPALPVAGSYRMVDVPLSNLHHSGLSDVWILEQYQPKSINDHLSSGRPWDLDRTHGGLRVLPPFEGKDGGGFAEGNADGIHRQAGFIREYGPDLVLVLSADHLYRLDYRDLIQTHTGSGAVLTMVTTRFDGDASQHGVVEAGDGMVTGFQYKPDRPATDLVTAEVFLYDAEALLDTLDALKSEEGGLQDYGDQLVPHLVKNATVAEHRLDGYWLDLGTPENYHRAHMDLVRGRGFNFDDPGWPVLTGAPRRMPAFVAAGARVEDSLLAAGSTVQGHLARSVIGSGTVVEAGAVVRDSVLLEGVVVGAGAQLTGVIVDSGARIGAGRRIDGTGHLITVDGDGREHS